MVVLAFLAGCIPGYDADALEAACLRVDVVPAAEALPAVPGAELEVDLAVCGCDAPEPCPDDALVPGRILALTAELGELDATSAYLQDGRGRTTFWSDGSVGLGSVVARTIEGFSGAAGIRLDPPLALGVDSVDLYPGATAFVTVDGAVEPLEEPEVFSSAEVVAGWDAATGLLAISTEDLVLDVTTGVVTVTDAAGQQASLTVFVQPGTPHPDEVLLSADVAALPADGFSTAVVTVTAPGVPDGTLATLYSTLGSFASYDLVLFDGAATGLFVASTDVGTATLLATVGSATSAPLLLVLEPLAD